MSDYTPITEEVRNGYIRSKRSAWQKSYAKEDIEFDRWLAEAKAEAWEEGYLVSRRNEQAYDWLSTPNPYKETA